MGHYVSVILLERLAGRGEIGDEIRVRGGYARNFLLRLKKALRATDANRKHVEEQRAHLEALNQERKAEAARVGEQLNGTSYIMIRQAGEGGHLYGSVSSRDIADVITAQGTSVKKDQVVIRTPVKSLGLYVIPIHLHTDVDISVTINVARSQEEAERLARGENTLARETTSIEELGLDIGAAIPEGERE